MGGFMAGEFECAGCGIARSSDGSPPCPNPSCPSHAGARPAVVMDFSEGGMAGRHMQYEQMIKAVQAFAQPYFALTFKGKLPVRARLLNRLLTELRKTKP